MTDRETHKDRYKNTTESTPRCRECGNTNVEHHHTNGTGDGDVSDLKPLCRSCHQDTQHNNPDAVQFRFGPPKMGGSFKQ